MRPKFPTWLWLGLLAGLLAAFPVTGASRAGQAGNAVTSVAGAWEWLPGQSAPGPRYGMITAWTGAELLVWRGYSTNIGISSAYRDGGRYNPATDTWQGILPLGGPDLDAFGNAQVWTGQELLVFNADMGGNYRYNPAVGAWHPIAPEASPTFGRGASVVWTGNEALVWGGYGPGGRTNTGARYDPLTDSWTPLASAPITGRAYHSAVWTGSAMIVWAGSTSNPVTDGARYNPATDTWTPISTAGAPTQRERMATLWTGSEMIVWGGTNYVVQFNSGARYNPATDTWTPLAPVNLGARAWPGYTWTGSEFVVWGGEDYDPIANYGDGARYNPATDTWTLMSPVNALSLKSSHNSPRSAARVE